MRGRVLVTRSGADAERTAGQLSAMGLEPLILPLTGAKALPAIALPDVARFDAIAVTSANAVRLAPARLLRQLAGKPCYAVAEHTAAAARDHGLDVVAVGTEGGALLGGMMGSASPRPAQVLFLAARTRSHELEAALADQRILVDALEIYDSRPIEHSRDHVGAVTQWRAVGAALVYSSQAAHELRQLAASKPFAFLFENTRYICMSERVAEALTPVPGGNVAIAAERNENAMLAVLDTAR